MKIAQFINRIKINRQFAKSTVDTYTRTLKRFNDYIINASWWARSIEDTCDLKVWDVESFIGWEKINGKWARTCNNYLSCIRDFISYAERSWEKVFNFKEIILMKESKRKIDALSEDEVQRLLVFMRGDKNKDELTRTRDLAMVSILLYTWLRVSELCNIKVDDVKEELQIIWKNQTLRLVYLFREHIWLIRLYLYMRYDKKIESDYLFCSHANNSRWKPLSRNTVEWIVKNAWKDAWLTNPVWPHKLRHTFATCLLRRGWNIYYIKELLGHQYITTTQTYLSATNSDLKNTQSLLLNQKLSGDFWGNERLVPMPENVIIKDKSLFDRFRNSASAVPNQEYFSTGFERGVSAYSWWWLG